MNHDDIVELPNIQAEYIYVQRLRCDRCKGRTESKRRGSKPGSDSRMLDIWDIDCKQCGHSKVIALSVPAFDIGGLFSANGNGKPKSINNLFGLPDLPEINPNAAAKERDSRATDIRAAEVSPPSKKKLLDRLTRVWGKSNTVSPPSNIPPPFSSSLSFENKPPKSTAYPKADKHFREYAPLVDQGVIYEWLEMVGEKIPWQLSMPGRIASMIGQTGVMAIMEKRKTIPQDREKALDIAMKFVETIWPFIPYGAKQRFGPEKWLSLEYMKGNDEKTLLHNEQVPQARREFKKTLLEILAIFPKLSAEEKSELIDCCPSITSLNSSSAETN